jgi:hypothetical protein
MDLTIDEQRLIAEFRKLPPSGKDELLACVSLLARQSVVEDSRESGTASNQCAVKTREILPEAEKSPIITE